MWCRIEHILIVHTKQNYECTFIHCTSSSVNMLCFQSPQPLRTNWMFGQIAIQSAVNIHWSGGSHSTGHSFSRPHVFLFFLQNVQKDGWRTGACNHDDLFHWEGGSFASTERPSAKEPRSWTSCLRLQQLLPCSLGSYTHSTKNIRKKYNSTLNLCQMFWWSLMEKRWPQKFIDWAGRVAYFYFTIVVLHFVVSTTKTLDTFLRCWCLDKNVTAGV